jgi:hypothetical protein
MTPGYPESSNTKRMQRPHPARSTPRLLLPLLLLVATACDRAPANVGEPATPAPVYALSDSAQYTGPDGSGTLAILTRDGVFVDTVDAAFGVAEVGRDSVVFLRVRGDSTHAATTHVLYDGAQRVPLTDIVPNFDSRYSAPAVLAGALYYWGIPAAGSADSVTAVRYEFARRRLNTIPVGAKAPAPGDRPYFTPPYLDGKEFVFKAPDGEWRFRTPRQR